MEEAVHSSRLVRFGTFEVDLPAGELRKSGVKLKLTGQPFQVLAILLERPGEVVTREELQKRLWPDTFVDVDHNLNTAINKIREVLGDSAESPRFVETLPRRGYRFVAPVEGAQTTEVAVGSESAGIANVWGPPTSVGWGLLAAWQWLRSRLICPAIGSAAPPKVRATCRLRTMVVPRLAGESFAIGHRRLTAVLRGFAVGFPSLTQVSTLGGETSAIATPFPVSRIGDISRTGPHSLIPAYAAGAERHRATPLGFPLPAGTPPRLGGLIGHDGTWFPDGQRIVFANGNDLYVARTDGTESKKLCHRPGLSPVVTLVA